MTQTRRSFIVNEYLYPVSPEKLKELCSCHHLSHSGSPTPTFPVGLPVRTELVLGQVFYLPSFLLNEPGLRPGPFSRPSVRKRKLPKLANSKVLMAPD